jgi:hypothetical protein
VGNDIRRNSFFEGKHLTFVYGEAQANLSGDLGKRPDDVSVNLLLFSFRIPGILHSVFSTRGEMSPGH